MTSSVRFAGLLIVRSILACGLLIAAAPRLWAGDEHVVGILSLAVEPAVLKELGLSDEAKEKLTEYVNKRVDESASLVLEIKDLDQAEQKLKLQPFVDASEKEGLKLLTADQQKKLQQVRLQRLGMAALLEKGVADQLGLEAGTRGKLNVMAQLHEMQTAAVPEAEKARAKVELEKKMLAMLTPEQRTKWEALEGRTGKEVAGAEVEPPTEPSTTEKPATKPVEKPTTDKPEVTRPGTTRPPTATTLKPANPNAGLKAGDPNIKIKFQFQFAPWKDVIHWFADQADYSLVTEDFPTGTFNYTDSRAYTPAQAIDLLNSVLITKGYRLVRRDRALFLLSSENELPDIFAPRIEEKDLDKQGDFEIVQCQFQLHKVTAEEAEVEVKKLVGLQGKVVVLSKARQVVVTETAGTLRLIRNAIKSIENPDTTKDEEVVVIKMDHIRPSEFMTLAGELLGIPPGMKATPDGSLKISADELGMRLIVTGKPEKITRLNDIKGKIDIVGGDLSAGGTTIEQPQLVIYTLHNADPVSVQAILSTMLAGQPDVRLSVDPKSGNLVALCRLTQHATIRGLLSEMQKDATKPVVFRLNKNDPQSVTLQINELFGGGEKGAPNAPKVVADPSNLQIIVKATPSQLAQIEELLKGMGELGGAGSAAGVPVAREHIRFLQGNSARSLENAFGQLETIWPTASENRNKLKVHRINRPADKVPATGPKAGEKPLTPEEKAFREEYKLDEPPLGRLGPVRLEPIEARPGVTPPPAAAPRPAPAAPVPAPTPRDSTRAIRPSASQVQFVSQPSTETEPKPAGSTEGTTPVAPAKGDEKPAEETPAEKTPEEKTVPGADITVSIGPNGIMIASDDLDALDEFEARLKQILDSRGSAKEPRIIYLKYAKAPVAAVLLQEILGGGAAAPSEGGGGGGLMGDLAAGMMGDSFLGGLLGMGGGGGGTSTTSSGGATIIPDIRLNALFVQASPRDMDVIDEYLSHIDQPESPEGPQPNSVPRFIPVINASVDAIAAVVRQVYAGRLTADAGGGQRAQPSPEDLIRALRGGRGGNNQQQNKGEEQKMTIGVDTRTNSLIVTAPDYLFKEVQDLVKTLDTTEVDSDTTVKVVSLRSANADLITRSLASAYPGSITTTRTATAATTGFGRTGTQGAGQRPPGQSQPAAPQQQQPGGNQQQGMSDDVRRQMEIFNALQGGGNRGGGGGGGNFGGGGGRGGGGNFGGGGGGRGGR